MNSGLVQRQQEFFGDPGEPTTRVQFLTLVITQARAVPLSKAQKTFNRLVTKIEALRRQIERENVRLNGILEFYVAKLHPLEQTLPGLRKELVRLLYPFTAGGQGLRSNQRNILRQTVSDQLEQIIRAEGSLVDDDLKAIFKAVEGIDLAEAERQDFSAMRDELEEDFAAMGVDIDLSEFRADLPPDELARKMEELRQQFQQAAGGAKGRGPGFGPDPAKKTKRQLAQELKERELEEMRKKDLGRLYKQLAKLLHPDLEQDPARRQLKEAAMKELTIAYKDNDLHALLRLELEWIHREQADAAQLTDQKLMVYNEVLKEQVAELESDLGAVGFHPRFQPVQKYAHPFFGLREFHGTAVLATLMEIARGLEHSIARLKGAGALEEVRQLVKAIQEANRLAGRGGRRLPSDYF